MKVSGWVQVSLGFFGKSSQNSRNPVLIFWSCRSYTMCNLFVYTCTLLKVVSYHLSVLSMSMMGLKKKVWMG